MRFSIYSDCPNQAPPGDLAFGPYQFHPFCTARLELAQRLAI